VNEEALAHWGAAATKTNKEISYYKYTVNNLNPTDNLGVFYTND